MKIFNVNLTEEELGYFYWRMKTNKWYERYIFASKRDNPWQEWMQATIEKLEPLYIKIDE